VWLVLITLAVAHCGPDVPAEMAPRLALAPCRPADNIEDGLCGTWEVFENRDAAAGRRITLRVVVLPALSTNTASDPVFILAGGPGQAASELTEAIRVPFRQVNRDRDLVFVDQRGTGGSNPLTCELDEEAPEEALLLDPMADELLRARVVEQLGACVASLDADPRFYTTPIAMDDLDDVREALGYDTINLWGGSYGTRAGLVFLRRHPDRVRTAILDGVAPVAMKLPLYMGMDAARERGSLEPLLINPVSRNAIVIGKWLVTVAFASVGIVLVFAGTLFMLQRMSLEDLGMRLDIGTAQVFAILAGTVPLAFLASGVQLFVSAFARSFKEAQTYVSMLIFIPMIPGMVAAVSSLPSEPWMAAVPSLGQQMLLTRVLGGDDPGLTLFLVAGGSSMLLGLLCVILTARLFQHERIVFGVTN
jgi:pimeloyl-ACP methyl ester carboxylesterase